MFVVQKSPVEARTILENGEEVQPLITLVDENRCVAHIIQDDHCFVLVLPCTNGRYRMVKHWFTEAAQALANYMLETSKAEGGYPPTWSMVFKESFSESLRPAWWKRVLHRIRNYFDLNKVL